MSNISKYGFISVLCALSSLSISARADVFLNAAVPGNFTFPGCPAADLPLSGGVQTLFFATGNTTVDIGFNAECAIDGSPAAFVGISLFVDPAPVIAGPAGDILVPPSSAAKALCSGDGIAGLTGWVSAQSQGGIFLGAGIHSIRVQKVGFGVPAGGACWISDRSLIVQN